MSAATVESEKVFNFSRLKVLFRSIVLTAGALVGGICLVLALLALVFGFRPVVVISGSMEPAIMTGSLIVGHKVAASKVTVGDVVTVPRPMGGLVTHRVVSTETANNATSLVLKGDANETADVQPYSVEQLYVVVGSVPKLGAVVESLRTPKGFMLLASFWLLFVLVYLWKPKQTTTSRKESLAQQGSGY